MACAGCLSSLQAQGIQDKYVKFAVVQLKIG